MMQREHGEDELRRQAEPDARCAEQHFGERARVMRDLERLYESMAA